MNEVTGDLILMATDGSGNHMRGQDKAWNILARPGLHEKAGQLLTILNCYTQYYYGWAESTQPLCSYPAIEQVMTTINNKFKGQHLGLPRIGAGLARGQWPIIKEIIGRNTPDLKVTIVHYCQ